MMQWKGCSGKNEYVLWMVLLFDRLMQLQTKPKYYADFNKHMEEAYYNYEAYEIEYG